MQFIQNEEGTIHLGYGGRGSQYSYIIRGGLDKKRLGTLDACDLKCDFVLSCLLSF